MFYTSAIIMCSAKQWAYTQGTIIIIRSFYALLPKDSLPYLVEDHFMQG